MPDFTVRSDSIDVEQIMEQIRARIREKRGVDYTEQQLRELAAVKLEKFLDPRGVRSDLLERFKERELRYDPPKLPLYTFEDTTIYETHRGPLQRIRKFLNPLLKLLFNPNPIIHALHSQAEINALYVQREEEQAKKRFEMESLYYEVLHNLVFETTRMGIEVKNLKMRVESLASRLEFNERRARALESVVAYRPTGSDGDSFRHAEPATAEPPASPEPAGSPSPSQGGPAEGPGQRSRRRRRRRGRRGGPPASVMMGGAPAQSRPDEARRPDSLSSEPASGNETSSVDTTEPDAQPSRHEDQTGAAMASSDAPGPASEDDDDPSTGSGS